MGDKFEIGSRTRREVLGDAHVDAATARATDFDAAFQTFITETAWGSVWARPDMDRRTRSLITISILAALGRVGELEMHLCVPGSRGPCRRGGRAVEGRPAPGPTARSCKR